MAAHFIPSVGGYRLANVSLCNHSLLIGMKNMGVWSHSFLTSANLFQSN